MKQKYFDLAEQVSTLSSYGRVKIGSVIVRGGKIISVGVNKRKTHPLQHEYNQYRKYKLRNDFLHSEMCAILNAKCNLRGSEIYVARKDNHGNPAICRPCEACMKALKDRGVSGVYYTTSNGYVYEKISKE